MYLKSYTFFLLFFGLNAQLLSFDLDFASYEFQDSKGYGIQYKIENVILNKLDLGVGFQFLNKRETIEKTHLIENFKYKSKTELNINDLYYFISETYFFPIYGINISQQFNYGVVDEALYLDMIMPYQIKLKSDIRKSIKTRIPENFSEMGFGLSSNLLNISRDPGKTQHIKLMLMFFFNLHNKKTEFDPSKNKYYQEYTSSTNSYIIKHTYSLKRKEVDYTKIVFSLSLVF